MGAVMTNTLGELARRVEEVAADITNEIAQARGDALDDAVRAAQDVLLRKSATDLDHLRCGPCQACQILAALQVLRTPPSVPPSPPAS